VSVSMSANRELHRQLRSGRVRFYPADLHVHSPASADVRSSPRFGQLPTEMQRALEAVPAAAAGAPDSYETQVAAALAPSVYYDLLVSRRNDVVAEAGVEDGDDWAVVAITDHNVCKYACDVAGHAWSQLAANRLVVLPGVELTVTYPVPPGEASASAHVLCVFSPGTSESDIRIAIRDASDANWVPGHEVVLRSLPDFVRSIRHHADYPAICVAAHVGTGEGVQSRTRQAILSRLEAAISRLRGEIEAASQADADGLAEELAQLEAQRDQDDQIALEILQLIGRCGFDALQVRGRKDEIHYRRLHRFREKMGRAVPIICSDAHRPQDVFATESGIPHIKLSRLSSDTDPGILFGDIAKALRFGETRSSYAAPGAPRYWISGIEVSLDAPDAARFWPFPDSDDAEPGSFVLPLSRNLNCLIGGRGSGKSAALEAVAFAANEQDFDGYDRKREKGFEDFYSRAQATLSGCNVKLCWQFLKSPKAEHLPKKAVFASRYFDPAHRHPASAYSSADEVELLAEQTPEHTVQYYRLGEIEKQARPEKLRVLFDRICGADIGEHEQRIADLTEELAQQRETMVEVGGRIAALTESGTPLRKYVQRARLYAQVNTEEMSAAYEEVDATGAAEALALKAEEEWSDIHESASLRDLADKAESFFDELAEGCTDAEGRPQQHHDELLSLAVREGADPATSVPRKRVSDVINKLDTELASVGDGLDGAKESIAGRAKGARDALRAQGLPTGSQDRQAKKTAFDDAQKALSTYRELVAQWDELNAKRKELVKQLRQECQARAKLRQDTAANLTTQLRRDLDASVLVVEADAQVQTDRESFRDWLDAHFAFQDFKHRRPRIEALMAKGLTPGNLRDLLLSEGTEDATLLAVDAESAGKGAISSDVASNTLMARSVGRCRWDPEVNESDVEAELWRDLPAEVREGLISFPTTDKDENVLRVDDVLKLDEMTFDDVPVIRLNDRPKDSQSKPRPVELLSPGQRCSAILPILLLTGTGPLLIDQPEDNMDNRLIRQVIVNILASMKLRRQVIVATHNPNLPVLGDAEQVVVLQGVGEHECQVRALGDLDSGDVVHHLTEVMEGGREAFQYRHTIYQTHWPGTVSTEADIST